MHRQHTTRPDPVPPSPASRASFVLAGLLALMLAGCDQVPPPRPEAVRARIAHLMPASLVDRKDWAADIHAAFASLELPPSDSNVCAVLAVAEQESGYNANPRVPGLAGIARAEIFRRAKAKGVPAFLVRMALSTDSADGRFYDERLSQVRTERDLSRLYEEFIASVPLGRRLLAGSNPVRTGGPMQVSITFAEQYAKAHPYPYAGERPIRHEVFTRRGGLYFGIAHLLGYPASYRDPVFRFGDYNAGFYASRNAAFQQAVSMASGMPLAPDGDLVTYGNKGGRPGATEIAVQSLSGTLGMSDEQIHRDLLKGDRATFERTALYAGVYEAAERLAHKPLPRAVLPRIDLQSPKITRRLTTAWFARRVQQRYRRCLATARTLPPLDPLP
jgi:hypothetical protein